MAKKILVGNVELAQKAQVDTSLSNKQDTLISGTNIKTINNESLLGSGNIETPTGLTEVVASDVNSEYANNGEVLTADGNGGASWQPISSGTTDYNALSNIPIINQDLDDTGFTPTANTYYKHIGASALTYEIGRVYYYNGSSFNVVLSQNDVETSAIQNSTKPISSGAVYSGLADKQNIIDANNKISADYVDDTTANNKFVDSTEKQQIGEIGDSNTPGTIIYRLDALETDVAGALQRLQQI